jgi:hypothetical protein
MEKVKTVAQFIQKHGGEGIEFEELLDIAESEDLGADISYVSTDKGRKEFGRLLEMTRIRFQIRNPWAKLRDSGASKKHDGRRLTTRTISRKKFCEFLGISTGVRLSSDVLRKAEIGDSINDETLFKIATARFVIHPGLDRPVELSEMIDVLREELTISDLERMRPAADISDSPIDTDSRSTPRGPPIAPAPRNPPPQPSE